MDTAISEAQVEGTRESLRALAKRLCELAEKYVAGPLGEDDHAWNGPIATTCMAAGRLVYPFVSAKALRLPVLPKKLQDDPITFDVCDSGEYQAFDLWWLAFVGWLDEAVLFDSPQYPKTAYPQGSTMLGNHERPS